MMLEREGKRKKEGKNCFRRYPRKIRKRGEGERERERIDRAASSTLSLFSKLATSMDVLMNDE